MKKYCKDCKKELSRPDAKRCRSCAMKGNQIALIDGRSTFKHYCLDCGKEIWYISIRCKKCAKQGELHSQFGTKRPDMSERMKGSNNPNFIDGRTTQKYYCSECSKEITYNDDSKGKCQQCYLKENIKDRNGRWLGGISKLPYNFDFNDSLKELIRKRDNHTCKNCGITEEEHLIVVGKVLSVHHIDYNKDNCKENNLISICNQCNARANSNRKSWQEYYNNLINKIIIKREMFNKKEYNKKYREIHREELNKDAIIRSKEWRIKHSEKYKEYYKKHYQDNKSKLLNYASEYRLLHEKKLKAYSEEYRKNNKEKMKELYDKWKKQNENYDKEYYVMHKDSRKEYSKKYSELNKEQRNIMLKLKRKSDIKFKILSNLRIRIWSALKGKNKSKTTKELLGCSINLLKKHLQSNFRTDMSWENYGTGWNGKGMQEWHVDHIIPCSSFDLSKPSEQRKCFHYTNLQPLWAKENLEKNDNLL